MNEVDLNALVTELQRATALGRLSHAEAVAVFERLMVLGYDVTRAKG